NESHSVRHKQNSNPESHYESEYGSRNEVEASGAVKADQNVHSLPDRQLPLGIVLDACPDVAWLATTGRISNWRDFLAAVEIARPALGVSPSAWEDAQQILGNRDAAVTLAAIYQRQEQIASAGG